jgi:hypothetical protein
MQSRISDQSCESSKRASRASAGSKRRQRIAYSVARVFAEIKVRKRKVLVRVFDMGVPDPRGIVADIPAKHNWQHQKEIPIDSLELVDYAMPFVAASYRSSLTRSPPVSFGRR